MLLFVQNLSLVLLCKLSLDSFEQIKKLNVVFVLLGL